MKPTWFAESEDAMFNVGSPAGLDWDAPPTVLPPLARNPTPTTPHP